MSLVSKMTKYRCGGCGVEVVVFVAATARCLRCNRAMRAVVERDAPDSTTLPMRPVRLPRARGDAQHRAPSRQ